MSEGKRSERYYNFMDKKCFLIERTDRCYQWLRRFTYSDMSKCPGYLAGHDAMTRIEDVQQSPEAELAWRDNKWPHDDARWPSKCQYCDYAFQPEDIWQLFSLPIYKGEGIECSIHPSIMPAPIGAMWNASWLAGYDEYKGPDGMSIVVRTPGGDWQIDSRASNCTMPDDSVHKCWVRHGTPPGLTVDKDGNTCKAGAGSIQCGKYHGFLKDGHLTDC